MSNYSDIGNLPGSSDSETDEPINPMSVSSSSDVTGYTQEKPTTDNVGPSQKPTTFACKVKQASVLKFAIEALCDPVHNNLGLGRIDVDVDGFNVTVENKNTNVVGHLFLKPEPGHFGCTKPIQGMIVNLPELYQKLTCFEDDDQLVIFQDDGVNKLYISNSGTWPIAVYHVELLENNAAIPKFPELSSLFCAHVPSEDVGLMLDHLLGQVPHEAIVEMMENNATLKAGRDQNRWTRHYPILVGVERGKCYRASFEWSREWLNKARDIETALALGHTAEQPTYIVWRFYLGEGYQLEYVKEPIFNGC